MTDQKVAIITGGNSGIGRATAIVLAKEGANITVAARRASEVEDSDKYNLVEQCRQYKLSILS
jgi:NAD(P)-dependent dehydrogenase (short-subunit alcohol dehydrogenase family)